MNAVNIFYTLSGYAAGCVVMYLLMQRKISSAIDQAKQDIRRNFGPRS